MRFNHLVASSLLAVALTLSACNSGGSTAVPGGAQQSAPMNHHGGLGDLNGPAAGCPQVHQGLGDELDLIAAALKRHTIGADLIVTTGGTGLGLAKKPRRTTRTG